VARTANWSCGILSTGERATWPRYPGLCHTLNPDAKETLILVSPLPQVAQVYGNVRALSQGKGSQILVGTTRNCIVAGNFEMPFSVLVEGHTDELWALCAHPNQNQFLSAGYDKRIQLWDSMSRSLIWSKDVAESLQSACFSPDGSLLVVGTTVGKWIAMDAQTRDIHATHVDGHEPIQVPILSGFFQGFHPFRSISISITFMLDFQVVKISPNGNLLAVGSRDNNIYVYQVNHVDHRPRFNRIGRCTVSILIPWTFPFISLTFFCFLFLFFVLFIRPGSFEFYNSFGLGRGQLPPAK